MRGRGGNKRKRAERFTFRPRDIHNPLAREAVDPHLYCGPKRKYAYPTRAAARRAAVAAENAHGSVNTPYECRACRFWHLTTLKQEK